MLARHIARVGRPPPYDHEGRVMASSASQTAAPAISVVICAYTEDRWDDLVAAVASVRHQTVPPHEIVVVIDYNPPLLARAGAALDGVMVVANQQARGLAGAR